MKVQQLEVQVAVKGCTSTCLSELPGLVWFGDFSCSHLPVALGLLILLKTDAVTHNITT